MFSFLESRKIRFERGSNHLKLTRFSQELQNIFSNPLFSLSLFFHISIFQIFFNHFLRKFSKIFVKFHFFKFHLRVKNSLKNHFFYSWDFFVATNECWESQMRGRGGLFFFWMNRDLRSREEMFQMKFFSWLQIFKCFNNFHKSHKFVTGCH